MEEEIVEKKNCYDCEYRIGNTCMEHAVMLKQKNGLPANQNDRELLKSLCWCETGIGGTQYKLKREAKE